MDKVRLFLCKLCSNNDRMRIKREVNFRLRRLLSSTISINGGGKTVYSSPVTPLPQYKVVFIGSDNFSLPSLVALTDYLQPENVSVVVSSESNVVSKYARKQGQKIYLWSEFKQKGFEDKMASHGSYDFGVVASFGYLIPARVIDRFPIGILNVHASLLPRWRGASPINHSIMNGDTETGISIMKIAPHKFDVGPVLLQNSIPLDNHIRSPDLLKLLAKLGATTLLHVIQDLPRHLAHPLEQDDRLASAAPKLTPNMAEIDWDSKTALEVYRLFRGLYGIYKLRTTFTSKRLDLDEIELANPDEIQPCPSDDGTPGQIVYSKNKNCVYVRCADATWISVKKLKIGLKWLTANDFKNGFLSKGKLSSSSSPYFYLDKNASGNNPCEAKLVKSS